MVELYDHQKKAIRQLHSGSILWGDVGTGKTLTALAYYVERESPRDIVVITTAKKRDSLDWEVDAGQFGIRGAGGSSLHGPLTVDSWNNISEYTDRKDAFFIFDEQRVVGSGAWTKAFISIAKQNTWILLSATPGDTWLDYIPVFVANGHFKNRTEFLRSHVVFSRFSKFPKVDRYTNVGKLVRLKNSILVEMPYYRTTTRHTVEVPVNHDQTLLERVLKGRWHVYLKRPLRDVAELFLVMRRVVNSDRSRLEAIRMLLETHPRLIVFYNFDFELDLLRTLVSSSSRVCSDSRSSPGSAGTLKRTTDSKAFTDTRSATTSTSQKTSGLSRTPSEQASPRSSTASIELTPTRASTELSQISEYSISASLDSALVATQLLTQNGLPKAIGSTTKNTKFGSGSELVIAEWNGHKHEPVPTSERWVYLVQYTAGAEGWNCIETNAMAFYSLTYSYKLWHQAFGRIDRLNTSWIDLYYYVLMSNSVIDKAIWRSLMGKKSFNERRYLAKILDADSKVA